MGLETGCVIAVFIVSSLIVAINVRSDRHRDSGKGIISQLSRTLTAISLTGLAALVALIGPVDCRTADQVTDAGEYSPVEMSSLTTFEELVAGWNYQLRPASYGNPANSYRDYMNETELVGLIEMYKTALQDEDFTEQPRNYLVTVVNLGRAYSDLAVFQDRAGNLDVARWIFNETARSIVDAEFPAEYSEIQYHLGRIYLLQSELSSRGENLFKSIIAFERALDWRKQNPYSLDYGLALANLGIAYADLAQIYNRQGNLEYARGAYRQAMNVLTPQRYPTYYEILDNLMKETEHYLAGDL
ncbi:MAG: hypothetical protein GF404_09010 [candidate division Zixibacteria bacterium]|nr:hypothetical protein [candidate division Zixibacteria bacterium]